MIAPHAVRFYPFFCHFLFIIHYGVRYLAFQDIYIYHLMAFLNTERRENCCYCCFSVSFVLFGFVFLQLMSLLFACVDSAPVAEDTFPKSCIRDASPMAKSKVVSMLIWQFPDTLFCDLALFFSAPLFKEFCQNQKLITNTWFATQVITPEEFFVITNAIDDTQSHLLSIDRWAFFI